MSCSVLPFFKCKLLHFEHVRVYVCAKVGVWGGGGGIAPCQILLMSSSVFCAEEIQNSLLPLSD